MGEQRFDEVLGNEVGIGGEGVVENEEEARPANTLPSPYMLTQSERDDHELTRAPYRSWCEHCVLGRGIEMAHRNGADHAERGVVLNGCD